MVLLFVLVVVLSADLLFVADVFCVVDCVVGYVDDVDI